jgi:membrane protein implicated in regulation of membrane protease activity
MLLGLIFAGMAVGAVVAGLWLLAGGSLAVAFALYSLVGTAVVLAAAVLSFLLSLGHAAKGPESGERSYRQRQKNPA